MQMSGNLGMLAKPLQTFGPVGGASGREGTQKSGSHGAGGGRSIRRNSIQGQCCEQSLRYRPAKKGRHSAIIRSNQGQVLELLLQEMQEKAIADTTAGN